MSQDMKCNCMWNNELNEGHNDITEKNEKRKLYKDTILKWF